MRSPGRFIARRIAEWRGHFLGIGLCVTAAALCGVGVQYGLKLVVDAMAGPRDLAGPIGTALAILLALIAGESLFWRLTGWLTCRATVGAGVDLRVALFEHLAGQPMRYFADNLAGSLGQRITATAGNFGALTNTVVWRTIPPLIDGIGAVVIFTTIDWRLTLTLAAFLVAVTAGMIWFGERGRPLHRTYSREAAAIGGDLVDVIANMWTVKAFSAREREGRRLGAGFRVEAEAQRRSWMYLEKARILHDVALWLTAAAMLTWTVTLWSRGAITPGDVVVTAGLTLRILHSSKDMALSLVDVAQQYGFIEETLSVVARPRTVTDAPDAPPLARTGHAIELRGVSFGYAEGGRDALHAVDLVIPAGEKLGIVGPSGAGKSTLIHLIQRLHDADRGTILLDGTPIAAVTQDSLRAAIAVVPQEIALLHRTVMENIRFARPEATDEEVFAAARAAACDRFVRALPQGYQTLVGERGTKLSGGQRQRIGIARAFLKDAPILLLDEATSALDTESELQILDALIRRSGDRTVIAVAHRLSTLAAFERVLVVSDGLVVEDGPAGELRRRGGLFAQMWHRQAEGLAADPVMDAA